MKAIKCKHVVLRPSVCVNCRSCQANLWLCSLCLALQSADSAPRLSGKVKTILFHSSRGVCCHLGSDRHQAGGLQGSNCYHLLAERGVHGKTVATLTALDRILYCACCLLLSAWRDSFSAVICKIHEGLFHPQQHRNKACCWVKCLERRAPAPWLDWLVCALCHILLLSCPAEQSFRSAAGCVPG